MWIAVALAGCTGSGTIDVNGDSVHSVTDDVTDLPTDPTDPTVDSATEPVDSGTTTPDLCAEPPPGPYPFLSSGLVHTEEDFDFEPSGLLAMQEYNNLVGITRFGDISVIAPNIGVDVAGIRTLPSGDILVAQQDLARVSRVNPTTGNTVNVVNGVGFPNGLEAGLDGWAYVSDFSAAGRVMMFDPYPQGGAGDNAPVTILTITYPNGLALSPDEQTLYVATSTDAWGGDGRLAAIDRDPVTGDWIAEPRLVYESGTLLDAIVTDMCGNVYVTEYSTGRVTRIRPDGTIDPIVDLPNVSFEGYCAARFGHGVGDWDRQTLYVSNRQDLYGIEIGIDGRHVLATP